MANKITRSQFTLSLKVQSNVLLAQSSIQVLQHHLEFLTRSGDLEALVDYTAALDHFSNGVLSSYSNTLVSDENTGAESRDME